MYMQKILMKLFNRYILKDYINAQKSFGMCVLLIENNTIYFSNSKSSLNATFAITLRVASCFIP